MGRPNEDLRLYAKRCDVRLWQVAERLEISECTFSKRLRHELSMEQKEEILAKIRELSTLDKAK